ncbi:DsrE family protein [Marinifilum sp.]|uniref:DsrE family protein n=1 Tax=Marinifilum sp. TaxID=2033137 RepID=UPI003BAD2CA6
MKKLLSIFFITSFICASSFLNCSAKQILDSKPTEKMTESKKLAVVWTSGDKDVAEKMVFMYTFNAAKHKWWDQINFIIWGPSSKLLSEDKDLQEYISKMMKVGINVYACKACADLYGVSESLEKIGVDVKYMGKPLTEYLQSDFKVMTF